jgi:hypothetical protein
MVSSVCLIKTIVIIITPSKTTSADPDRPRPPTPPPPCVPRIVRPCRLPQIAEAAILVQQAYFVTQPAGVFFIF